MKKEEKHQWQALRSIGIQKPKAKEGDGNICFKSLEILSGLTQMGQAKELFLQI